MSFLSARRDDITVVIPQSLIDRALKESVDVVEEIVPYDEGLPFERPLYLEEQSRISRLGRLTLITAIVGSIVMFTGLQVADSHAPVTLGTPSVTRGMQTMSAAELVQTIKTENRTVFWLNSKQGDSYSNDSSSSGIDQVTYRPEGASVANLNQFDVIVGTYKDYSTFDSQPRPLLGANGRTVNLANGATVTYNSASPTQALVLFRDRPEVIVLNYPAVQAVPTIINDASNLVPIS